MGCGRPSLSFSTGPKLPDATSGAFAGSAKGATASPHSFSDIDQPPPLLRRKPHCSTRLGSLSGPDWLHHSTRCCRGPKSSSNISSGIFSAIATTAGGPCTAPPATRTVATSSHHHLPPAVIASAHHLPPPLIASPRSSVGPLRQHQWTLGLITCVGTQAETFRVTKRTPGSTLAPTGHPCSGLVRVIPCAGCHLCAGACYCMWCANCNRII